MFPGDGIAWTHPAVMRNSQTNSAVRSTSICLSVFVVFFSAIGPGAVVADNNPVLDTFHQWLDAFNSGEESKISGFW